ncbi:MAG: type-F conjugative transfer system pilin assembly protein TrbC [Deferrisomatales bacterium]|nr:type-F conjugative transfer system pilin assembly protein TrbC [Deferrisomatales bacterium]
MERLAPRTTVKTVAAAIGLLLLTAPSIAGEGKPFGGSGGPTSVAVPEAATDSLRDLIRRMETRGQPVRVESLRNVHDIEAREKADDVSRRLHSTEELDRLGAENARLQQEVFGEFLGQKVWDRKRESASLDGLPPTDRIYLFISESVPLETLRNYARDVADLGDPRIVMVLRGFVGGMRHVLPTRRFVLDVLRKDLACNPEAASDCELYPVSLVIDPLLFRRYDIQAVPAVAYAQDVETATSVTGEESRKGASQGLWWRISGDVELGELLRRIQSHAEGDALISFLRRIL